MPLEERAFVVLEEDGTEVGQFLSSYLNWNQNNLKVDEEEYFDLLPERTHLMLLAADQLWSPNISLQG